MKSFTPRKTVLSALATGFLSLAACVGQSAYAADWPAQPVTVVVAFTAGGTTDILAREISNGLTKKWGQSVVVENRPGAGGNIGTRVAINAKPDGYTLLINSIGPIAINPSLYSKLGHNPQTDLIPLTLVADVPNVLVVSPSLNIKSVEELIAAIKKEPEKYNCASTGVGTAAHLSCELLARSTKLPITHIPYKGAGALTDVIAGRVQFMFATLPSVKGHIKSGALLPLAVSTASRSPALPNIPSMKEAGYPDFALGAWFGFFAPKDTPVDIVNKISRDIDSLIHEPGVKAELLNEGAEPIGGTPAEFKTFVDKETGKWSELVKSMNISLD
jgi:tripartite-type tricarboxylate transporter receptor subunit TctC